MQTIVIFRKFKEGDIIALFPQDTCPRTGFCNSYMHVGQHGDADYLGLIKSTKLAKPSEYRALLCELKSIGYDDLIIKSRFKRR